MNVVQPFPYQGSKRKLAPIILEHIPADSIRVIEPFSGSAAVSLAVATSRRGSRFLLNDLNSPLIDLWREIIDRPDDLAAAYHQLWEKQQGRPREFYDEVRCHFNRHPQPDLFLYLLARCVKASVRYNSNGEFNQSPDNRRLGMTPPKMRQNLLRTSKCLSGRTKLSVMDYRDALASATPSDLVYMDPPYQGVCGTRDQRYLAGVEFIEFVEVLSDLNERGVAWILSYDGRTGAKEHGRQLPPDLQANRLEVHAGRSTQATLLGGDADTYESIYLSPALLARHGLHGNAHDGRSPNEGRQLSLFGD